MQKLLASIRDSIGPLRELQKNADPDEKLILADVVDRLFTARELLGDIQAQMADLSSQNEKLKQTTAQRDQWISQKANFEPFRFFAGGTVMVEKDDRRSPYCRDWYCKHCFDNERRSQLQPDPRRHWEFVCPSCKTPIALYPRDQEAYNEAHNQRDPATG